MEDSARLSLLRVARIPGRWSGRRRLAVVGAFGLVLAATGSVATAQPPRPPAASPGGAVWGRVAVEEESPDGPWTPLGGVDVRLLPDPRPLAAALERLRQSARGSWRDHDEAVGRIQTALQAHQARVEAAGEKAFTATTGPWGTFALDQVPPGDWLLVAIRVAPYRRASDPGAARSRGGGRPSQRDRFVQPSTGPVREAEIWVMPLRVAPDERVRVLLTDRARWLAGPVR